MIELIISIIALIISLFAAQQAFDVRIRVFGRDMHEGKPLGARLFRFGVSSREHDASVIFYRNLFFERPEIGDGVVDDGMLFQWYAGFVSIHVWRIYP